MKMTPLAAIALVVFVAAAGRTSAVVITSTYTQNFDSMGTGTSMPTDWTEFSLSGSHDDFRHAGSTAAITTTVTPAVSNTAIVSGPSGSATLTQHSTLAFVQTDPSGTGFRSSSASNFATASSPTDRALGTSPTGVAGNELQLTLTNGTGGPLSSFSIGYDIRRFSTTVDNNGYTTSPDFGVEEFPGYWPFYSLDNGAHWTNISSLNPTLSGPGGIVVPNSIGVTNVAATAVALGGSWADGTNMLLRWFDDNAQSPSPDQYIALDNVSISVPEPASLSLLGIGACAMLWRKRRGNCVG